MRFLNFSIFLLVSFALSFSHAQTCGSPQTGLSNQWPNICSFDAIELNAGNKMYLGGRNSEGFISWNAYPNNVNSGSNEALYRYANTHAAQIVFAPWAAGSMVFRISPANGSFGAPVQWNQVMTLRADGEVHIGTIPGTSTYTGYRLFVEEGIVTGKVKVDQGFADYVFDADYPLMPLAEVDAYITEKGHLPGFPSEAEIEADGGFEVGDITVRQQEKIEELFLHVIALEQRLEQLAAENTQLKSQQDHE